MQKLDGVSLQDAVALRGREIKLVQDLARILYVLRGENVRAHHDAVRADHGDQELERLRIVDQIVVVEAPQVFPERVSQRDPLIVEVREEMLNPSGQIREGAARV